MLDFSISLKKGQYYFIYFPCRNQNQGLARARDLCITERYSRLLIVLVRMSSTILDKTKKNASPGLVLDWEVEISFSHY